MRIAITNDNNENITVLEHIINQQPDLDLAWTAHDGLEAIEKCKNDTPDLILMDMIMPSMNGVEACQTIMKDSPCAIIIVTASITGNAAMVFEAMSYGAIDVVKTPFSGIDSNESDINDLLHKINMVCSLIKTNCDKNIKRKNPIKETTSSRKRIIVLGASTGGPGALASILKILPADLPVPIIIVQHVDSSFTHSFASWLNKQSALEVRLACRGDIPTAGTALIAGESDHLIMNSTEKLTYSEEPKELIYKPSVDVLFNSVVKHWKGTIIAALLTGMGKDGAQGLAHIHNKGGHTMTQSEDTCAVYGMPKAAFEMGAATESLTPDEIARSIMNIVYGNKNNG